MDKAINNPEFAASRQAQWSTSPEIIIGQVSKITNGKAKIERRIRQGGWNEVYVVNVRGERYVLRISREPELILKEKIAKDMAAEAGVPIAKTIDLSTLLVDGKELIFELTKFVDGPALHQVVDIGVRKDLLKHAGLLLSKIHTIKCHAYGPFPSGATNPINLSLFRSNQMSFINPYLVQISETLHISQSSIESMIDLVNSLNKKHDEDLPVLAHMDFHPHHLICSPEEKQIVAVLDFGNCRSASPFDDFANWIDGEFALSDVLSGYSDSKLINSSDFETRISLARFQGNMMQFPFAIKNNLRDKVPLIWKRVLKQVEILKLNAQR